MSTIAILPVKSFGAAKQRLGSTLGAGSRQALAQAMFSDVLSSLRRVPGLDSVAVVTADRVAEAAALGERVQVLGDTAQAGQSAAALIGIDYALASGFDRVLLVPGDTPLLDPGEVAALLRRGDEDGLGVVIVPDRHGAGTNALLLSPADAIEPAFGPGSRERHQEAARTAGVSCAVERVPTLELDVDTGQDLELLAATLEGRRGQAPSTRGALRQLDRAQAWRRPPVPA
ncbi:MAG: 2-phospho-L-lactate/phosphoenolpyruvate guanylyltransferase [Thermoleophilaceae bacterium]|jgi:2-phospho-L-lactate guanylyltransferase|nr:2-phospho-L-lactate/phosphoenolpyruvate guanylyltransferase [Thermoleophilaceae bacterium]MEA2401641.1 2-phospho-L-lactate/phosphoenolpyruvate guanylyltransferase [Thermoleophilaceae bacterium]